MKFAIPIVPPGRQTRSISSATARWSGAHIAPTDEITASNSPSAKGSASASASDPVERDAERFELRGDRPRSAQA